MVEKETYRNYCKNNQNLSLFQQDWWMDAVCGESNWDARVYKSNGNILGTWAFPYKKKLNLKLISMPMLTPGTGPYIHYFPGQKKNNQISHEQQVLEELISSLPVFDLFDLYLFPEYKNHLSFYWKGFSQSTRYTYILKDLTDLGQVFDNFNSNIRTQIRKAEKELILFESNDIDLFYEINCLSFKRQKKQMPYSKEYVKKIDLACTKNNCRKIILVKDKNEQVHAALYLVWDAHSAYYLMGGADEQFKNSGAYSLLIWKAIQESAHRGLAFNFCGSMISSIERFFRSFGGEQTPYLHLKKINSRSLKLYLAFKEK